MLGDSVRRTRDQRDARVSHSHSPLITVVSWPLSLCSQSGLNLSAPQVQRRDQVHFVRRYDEEQVVNRKLDGQREKRAEKLSRNGRCENESVCTRSHENRCCRTRRRSPLIRSMRNNHASNIFGLDPDIILLFLSLQYVY